MDEGIDGKIFAHGWSQGHAFPKEAAKEFEGAFPSTPKLSADDVVLVARQTCAVLHGGDKVPTVDVILAKPVAAVNGDYVYGKNQYRLDFQLIVEGQPKPYRVLASDLVLAPKRLFADYGPSLTKVLDSGGLTTFRRWLGDRFTRLALPDDFEETIGPQREGIKKALKPASGDIQYILLSLDPGNELAAKEKYKLVIWLVMPENRYADPSARSRVGQAAGKLEALLQKCDRIGKAAVTVRAATEVTLADLDQVSRWDAFDDLSSRDPSAPQPSPLA